MDGIKKNGRFSIEWKTGKLILIEKPTRIDGKKSYRPICLLDVSVKLLEQIINNRLREDSEAKSGLYSTQFGFRKGRTTMNAIQKVQEIALEASKNKNKFAVMITINVKTALNIAPWILIIKALMKRQIAPYLIKLMCK